jgi:adenylate cyclase
MTPMADPWHLRVYEGHTLAHATSLVGPAELGRQNKEERPPYHQTSTSSGWRVVVARIDEDLVSRKHLRIEPLNAGRVRLTNLSERQAVRLGDGGRLEPGAAAEVPLPVAALLGTRTIRIEGPVPAEPELQSLAEATHTPGREFPSAEHPVTRSLAAGAGLDPEDLVRWLRATLGVLQGAAGSADFFTRAARAVVDLVGLDSGRVLLRDQGEWQVRAVETAAGVTPEPDWQPSRQVLEHLLRDPRTFWQGPAAQPQGSLLGVKAVVAAPILDRHRQVIGALYGDRRQVDFGPGGRPISRLEAMLVDVLAGGVAAGLARLEQEQAAVRARVSLEQFFTRELYQELEARPDLLQPRDAEVTALFCDIRGFSRISERLGSGRTVAWISDVMGSLTECVLAERGVVVEYIGDEVLAMWGAPVALADDAARACRAALAMLARLPELNERWEPILGERMSLGIGLNRGVVQVGNVGSKYKFKYGPLGSAVNLASRVQGATKYLKVPVLLTRAVRDLLGAGFAVRRLCRVRVVNIQEPVDLFELTAGERPEWAELRREYERALEKFESGNLRTAVRILGNLHSEYPEDGPTLLLLSRAVAWLDPRQEPAEFDPVWELPGK